MTNVAIAKVINIVVKINGRFFNTLGYEKFPAMISFLITTKE